jgi:hypothetical protein
VAAALSLLVTTSFLGLRRYLRQRRIEMPIPVTGTWIALGAVLIGIVMFVATLIPRPAAEVALSRVPWQADSPGHAPTSRNSVGNDGQQQQEGGTPTNEQPENSDSTAQSPGPNKGSGRQSQSNDQNGSETKQGTSQGQGEKSAAKAEGTQQPSNSQDGARNEKSDQSSSSAASNSENKPAPENSQPSNSSQPNRQNLKQQPQSNTAKPLPNHPMAPKSPLVPPAVFSALGGLTGIVKILFYAGIALFVGYLVWKHRNELAKAIADILRELRNLLSRLFGGKPVAKTGTEDAVAATEAPPARFADFRDPFATGDSRRWSPEELVRYTFSAFEAWANDHGCPRTPDRTPAELVRAALSPESPMYGEARQMVRLYSEVAYAARKVSRETASSLRQFWKTMSQA